MRRKFEIDNYPATALKMILAFAISTIWLAGFSACKNEIATEKSEANPELEKTPIRNGVDDENGKDIDWGSAEVDKFGVIKANLIVSLDYFPKNRPDQATLPLCRKPLDPNLEIGRMVCEDGEGAGESIITAGNVSQECYTVPEQEKIASLKGLKMLGCARVKIVGFAFSPELRIDIEKKL